jgi:ABC-2 type transport system ATP-binding protein
VLGLDAQHDRVEIHRRVGYLPGDLALFPRMTGQQHLDWFRRARRQQGDESLTRELVERFEVVLDRPTKELSTGNRQKIGLVMAFMHRPELVVLDEPTAGLDPLVQDEFERLAREVVADGRTVFLSSHDLDEVQRMADRVGIIRAGRLVTTDTVDNLRRKAPQHVEALLPGMVDAPRFDRIPGVSVTECQDNRVVLAVSGPIGPLLSVLGELDPVDVVVRRANLDELFLDYYRGERSEVSDAR